MSGGIPLVGKQASASPDISLPCENRKGTTENAGPLQENEVDEEELLAREVIDLQARLEAAKERLAGAATRTKTSSPRATTALRSNTAPPQPQPPPPSLQPPTHFLLLLSDSALPLGAFAFSSGLESYLAHARQQQQQQQQRLSSSVVSASTSTFTSTSAPSATPTPTPTPTPTALFTAFLPLSVAAYASTTLPFALAGHRAPESLLYLDDALDASIICTVGRRASVAQGRALLSVWERCFAPALLLPNSVSSAEENRDSSGCGSSNSSASEAAAVAQRAISAFAAAVKATPSATPAAWDIDESPPPPPSAHLAPLFGAVCAAAGLDAGQCATVLMLSHVKALVSAAVRAGVFGPYQAQRLLSGAGVRDLIGGAVRREWSTRPEEAGQSVPAMDLWVGRHEVLYSRIFNS